MKERAHLQDTAWTSYASLSPCSYLWREDTAECLYQTGNAPVKPGQKESQLGNFNTVGSLSVSYTARLLLSVLSSVRTQHTFQRLLISRISLPSFFSPGKAHLAEKRLSLHQLIKNCLQSSQVYHTLRINTIKLGSLQAAQPLSKQGETTLVWFMQYTLFLPAGL